MEDDVNPNDLNAAFTEQFNAVIERKALSTEKVAACLNVPEAMVERWKAGVSSPYPALREFVLRDLESL